LSHRFGAFWLGQVRNTVPRHRRSSVTNTGSRNSSATRDNRHKRSPRLALNGFLRYYTRRVYDFRFYRSPFVLRSFTFEQSRRALVAHVYRAEVVTKNVVIFFHRRFVSRAREYYRNNYTSSSGAFYGHVDGRINYRVKRQPSINRRFCNRNVRCWNNRRNASP